MERKRTIRTSTLIGVGDRLRVVREYLGMTQAQFAFFLNIERQALNKWERGTRNPDVAVMIRLCGATDCTLDFIYRGNLGNIVRDGSRDALTRAMASPAEDRPRRVSSQNA